MTKDLCVYPGEMLLPADHVDHTAWACVACDQYTAQPEYWREVERLVGEKPSVYHMILPECWLDQAEARIPLIHAAMRRYLTDGTLTPGVERGFILTERSTGTGARLGLMCLLDLEHYDPAPGARTLVRASEGTVEGRIPPRVRMRENAPLENSHVMLLMDDPMHSVTEPLFDRRDELQKLYDFPLMMNGGHLTGYAVTEDKDVQAVYDALDALRARLDASNPLLFVVGDGNHSLATAKACWEKLKPTLTPAQTAAHPARFTLVEIENIRDDALQFEPIHRVLFGYDGDDLLDEFSRFAASCGIPVAEPGADGQPITVVYEGKEATLNVQNGPRALAVETLQALLDAWLKAHPQCRLDYIHGEQAVRELVKGEGVVGFLLPKPEKETLFSAVAEKGALPRKSFSIGEANEKRYYMECRRK